MDFNDLKIFQTVAERGSISRAALELNYVQSNVTARIKLLEKELNTVLFYRHKRGMILSPEGKIMLQHTRELMSKLEAMRHTFEDRSKPSGMLEVGTVETVNALPGILSSFYSKYPQVELSLRAGVTEHLLQQVIDMKLDGAFITGPVRHPHIEQFEVIKEKLVLVSKREHFSIEDLTRMPLLLYNKGCAYRERLERWMKAEGIVPKKVMAFGAFGTIMGSVAAGIGITVITESSIVDQVENGTVYAHPIPKPYDEVTTIFVRRKDAHVSHTLQCFIDEIIGYGK